MEITTELTELPLTAGTVHSCQVQHSDISVFTHSDNAAGRTAVDQAHANGQGYKYPAGSRFELYGESGFKTAAWTKEGTALVFID